MCAAYEVHTDSQRLHRTLQFVALGCQKKVFKNPMNHFLVRCVLCAYWKMVPGSVKVLDSERLSACSQVGSVFWGG